MSDERRQSRDIGRIELIRMVGYLRGLLYSPPKGPQSEVKRVLAMSTFDVSEEDRKIESQLKPLPLNEAERSEMLAHFVGLAMGEDCQGTALTTEMERVELYMVRRDWLSDPENLAYADPEVIAEEREGMIEIENWWITPENEEAHHD